MKRTVFLTFGLLVAALATAPALAQQLGGIANTQLRGLHSGVSLSTPATTPLDAQIQNNNAAQLRAEQRDLLQQNPSGATRQERAISRALNGFTPR